MPMTDRSAEILSAAIREFIATGEPVSSGLLFDKYEFGIRPAMIRLELRDLVDEGFLEQPSHSAGRVPTDRGYKFFAEKAIAEHVSAINREMVRFFEQSDFGGLLDHISRSLGLLGVVADFDEGGIYKEGLEDLVQNLEWQSKDELGSVIRDFECLDRTVWQAAESLPKGDPIKVFIGKQSPVTKSECLSVFTGDYDVGGDRVVLMAIGPKRMDYEKAAKVFKGIRNAFK